MKEFIEMPFGAKDSELGGWEYNIPEGFVASIENGKIIVKKEEGEDEKDEKIRMALIHYFSHPENTSFEYWEAIPKSEAIAWLEKQGEKKPAWSEEDENRFNNLKWLVERSNESKATKEGFIKFINNLKSLKERVQPQPKQEWSEKDEYVYNEILKRVADKKLYEHDLEYIYKWLKSLKPQPQWKPSEEQIQALEYQVNSTYKGSWQYKASKELLEQLKKL